jgi:hypothetical protein
MKRLACAAVLLLPLAASAEAQAIADAPEPRAFSAAEIAAVPMPETRFARNDAQAGDFEKYYYFHRDATSFDQAFADIAECDQLSVGLASYSGEFEPYPGYYASQYGIGGAIGAALGAMFADMIHGSAARREMRRVNMRNCMGYKGYQRYGIPKDLWEAFNFEEGNGRKDEDIRAAKLLQQAKVASGPKPQTQVLAR